MKLFIDILNGVEMSYKLLLSISKCDNKRLNKLFYNRFNTELVFIRPFEKTGRIMEWRLCPSVRPSVRLSVNIKVCV